ncbi:chloramphenicol phosphotransferase CPT family protein [Robertmurraya korlensis]|uniref:chloramphenicol phosphotransferase CPT family protein n=1 Tax=Robertmurraya korlensis TaxID=519977 RepID=UPI000825501D|nr:AAA family ATPase [Robertmurraya korlensis]
MKGKIIFLNGVSSAGKSTLSKKIVKHLPNYFHFSVDDFDLIIERMEERGTDRLIPVPTETFFHQSIAMFSDQGVNLIVDHVLHDEETVTDAYKTLRNYPIYFVGVHCPLEELERREQVRGDRRIGQAKLQLQFVHQQSETYNIEVDTFKYGMEKNAQAIADFVKMNEATLGFSK